MRHCVTFKPSSCVKVLETMTLTLPTTGCAKKLIFWGFRRADDFNVGLKEYPMDIVEKMKLSYALIRYCTRRQGMCSHPVAIPLLDFSLRVDLPLRVMPLNLKLILTTKNY
jgi:hypothetical protein